VRAARQFANETTTAGIACDARGQGQTFCRLERGEVLRIDQLAGSVRAQLGETPHKVPRAAVLRALLLNGLDIAEARGIAPAPLHGLAVRVQYVLGAVELDRLARFRLARWSRSTAPPTEKLQGAIVRLALPGAETSESFAREVFAALLPRGRGPT
jgi:hypothetical protein